MLQFVLPRLVQLGIREICAPADWQKETRCRDLFQYSQCRFLLHRDLNEPEKPGFDLSVPRATLFLPKTSEALPQKIINADCPLHVIFAWDDTPERDRPGALFFDKSVHGQFDGLVGRLSQ